MFRLLLKVGMGLRPAWLDITSSRVGRCSHLREFRELFFSDLKIFVYIIYSLNSQIGSESLIFKQAEILPKLQKTCRDLSRFLSTQILTLSTDSARLVEGRYTESSQGGLGQLLSLMSKQVA